MENRKKLLVTYVNETHTEVGRFWSVAQLHRKRLVNFPQFPHEFPANREGNDGTRQFSRDSMKSRMKSVTLGCNFTLDMLQSAIYCVLLAMVGVPHRFTVVALVVLALLL